MHDRYTVCSVHKTEGHEETSDWRQCHECREHFAEFETYVGMGTSSFNFMEDRWDEAPTFDPTYCSQCKGMMKLNSEGYTTLPDGESSKICERCNVLR